MKPVDQEKTRAPLNIDRAFLDQHSGWMLALAKRILQDTQLAEDAL